MSRPGELIHYGDSRFKPSGFLKITNAGWIKPKGGLWTSPVKSNHSWRNWCEAESFRDCEKEKSFTITLKENARIVVVNGELDLRDWPEVEETNPYLKDLKFMTFKPDFETIAKHYDAIWLTEEGERNTRYTSLREGRRSLYGWDCETVLILNKELVEFKKE